MTQVLKTIIEISVDADWYLSAYPDAKKDIAAGIYTDALDHYLRVGIREGRFALEPVVSEDFYRSLYPDVDQAISDGLVQSAQQHYTMWGYRERRAPAEDGEPFTYQPKRYRPPSLLQKLRLKPAALRQVLAKASADYARSSPA
jgi:hypothetical protein